MSDWLVSRGVRRLGRRVVLSVTVIIVLVLAPTALATFPGANGRIAFSHDVGPSSSAIATMEPDGSRVRDLTSGFSPAWSADGRRIVFMRANGMNSDIYMMRADGSRVRRLTSTPRWWEAGPTFSPDGRKIVFYRLFRGASPSPSLGGGGGDIVVMRLNDLRMRFVTEGYAPEWAPNGKRIVFWAEGVARGAGIATIRPDGTRERRLTSPPEPYDSDVSPAYAPGGRTIYFVREPWDGPCALMRMGAFGGRLRQVPAPDGCPGYPAPAPEGGCVVAGWPHPPDASGELYALGPRCPAQGWLNQQGGQPSWQPLPDGYVGRHAS